MASSRRSSARRRAARRPAARGPAGRRKQVVVRRRRVAGLVAIVVLCAVVLATLHGGQPRSPGVAPFSGGEGAQVDPFAYRTGQRAAFERRAAAGLAEPLYLKSPGGAVATAQRVARFRPLIERAARAGGISPDTVEGIVFLESAGRPDAQASNDLNGAAGLTQILAETGRHLLHMHVDVARSARLTRGIRRGRKIAQRQAARRRADERFDPAKALAATVRYLRIAKQTLHRDDLAIASYHMGIGNLQQALGAYGQRDIAYAQLYFDATPVHHAEAWRKLASLGDDSSTYLWRVLAAERIMRTYRQSPAALGQQALAHTAKASAEEVLHPAAGTPAFRGPADVAAAERSGMLVKLSAPDLAGHGLAIAPSVGELGPRLGQSRRLYRALRPGALRTLELIGTAVHQISGTEPLTITSSVRDRRYQSMLGRSNPEATHAYSLHTTGWAFDLSRGYRSRAQAMALQFVLDRLTALNMIAWVREPTAIHVTVAG